ncbi:hypothetical protein Tco_1500850, partial [Tanacetum coccineum]
EFESINQVRMILQQSSYKILDIDVKVGRLPGDLHNVVKRREYKLVIRGMKYDLTTIVYAIIQCYNDDMKGMYSEYVHKSSWILLLEDEQVTQLGY